jgi:hypothetical protein
VIKEVKYLKEMNLEQIPSDALAIYDSSDLYREYIINLDYITTSYNNIMSVSSQEERTLIKKELLKITAEIVSGEMKLKWNSPNIGKSLK